VSSTAILPPAEDVEETLVALLALVPLTFVGFCTVIEAEPEPSASPRQT